MRIATRIAFANQRMKHAIVSQLDLEGLCRQLSPGRREERVGKRFGFF
jgi:hypothetical protein